MENLNNQRDACIAALKDYQENPADCSTVDVDQLETIS